MLITPPLLQAGNKIAIVAPGKAVSPDQLKTAISVFNRWGLEVVLGENIFKNYYQFSSTDQNRLADLQWALDNREIRAVVCARGGYGTTRFIDQLDLTKFAEQPKWVVGFSDITVLLAKINLNGYQAIHGVMPAVFDWPGIDESIESLRKLLFEGNFSYSVPPFQLNKDGIAQGEVTGGTLTLLCNSIGTATEVDTTGKILFLEDIGEYLYALDRMIIQLKRAGKLEKLAGLVVGRFADTKDSPENPFGKTIEEIIAEAVKEYNYPVCFNFPVGHIPENMALPCGSNAVLKVESGYTSFFSQHSLT